MEELTEETKKLIAGVLSGEVLLKSDLTEQQKQHWIDLMKTKKKTTGKLKKDDSYCCLGVLAESLGKVIQKNGCNIVNRDAYTGGLHLSETPVRILFHLNDFQYRDDEDFTNMIKVIERNVIAERIDEVVMS